MQSLLVTVNRAAGTADDAAVEAALNTLRTDACVTVATTADETELVEALADLGDRRLIVIGGDGSVHAAVNALDRVGHLDPRDPVGVIREAPAMTWPEPSGYRWTRLPRPLSCSTAIGARWTSWALFEPPNGRHRGARLGG
jgi:hypothetical protein